MTNKGKPAQRSQPPKTKVAIAKPKPKTRVKDLREKQLGTNGYIGN